MKSLHSSESVHGVPPIVNLQSDTQALESGSRLPASKVYLILCSSSVITVTFYRVGRCCKLLLCGSRELFTIVNQIHLLAGHRITIHSSLLAQPQSHLEFELFRSAES